MKIFVFYCIYLLLLKYHPIDVIFDNDDDLIDNEINRLIYNKIGNQIKKQDQY